MAEPPSTGIPIWYFRGPSEGRTYQYGVGVMQQFRSSTPRIAGARLLVGALAAASLAACGSASADDSSVPLLRADTSNSFKITTESGKLDGHTGCMRFIRSDGFEQSLIFMNSVNISTDYDHLLINDEDYGQARSATPAVTLELQDGPVVFEGSGVQGPTDRLCNGTAPSYVLSIHVDG